VPDGKWDPEVKAEIEKAFDEVGGYIEEVKLAKSLERVLQLGDFANKYFNDRAPWVDIKEDEERAKDTMFNAIQLVNALRLLLRPYTPFACKELSKLLNVKDEFDANEVLLEKGLVEENINTWKYEEIEVGRGLEEPEILWQKID
jgi:methionyl-tRNA synthetase